MTKNQISLFSLLPLLSFFAGYYCISSFTNKGTVATPHLLGLSTMQAVMICSDLKLNPTIIATRYHQELTDGTVLEQIPEPNSPIKALQSINLVVSMQPPRPSIPPLYGMPKQEAETLLAKHGFKIVSYTIPHQSCPNTCFAYQHRCGELSNDNTALLYVSSGEDSTYIWPQLCGHSLGNVQEFLASRDIVPHVLCNEITYSDSSIVTDQRPLAGSIIRGKEKPYVQLKVSKGS